MFNPHVRSRSGPGFAGVCGLATAAIAGAVVADGGRDPFSPVAIGALPFSDTGDTTGATTGSTRGAPAPARPRPTSGTN